MSSIQLYDYQQEAVDTLEANIAFGTENMCVDSPTGSGKSIIMAEFCRRHQNMNIIIMVSMQTLIDQLSDSLKLLGVDHSIVKAGRESEFDDNKNIHIVMAQTLYARMDKLNLKCDILIKDEYHYEYSTKRARALLSHLEPASIIGFTATPFTAYGFKLKGTEIIKTVDINTLTERGFLAPLKYYVPKWSETIDYSSLKSGPEDYNQSKLNELIKNKKHIDSIVQAMNDLDAKNKKTIVFVTNIDFANELTAGLQNDGYDAFALHSGLHKQDEKNILEAFRNNTKFEGFKEELETTSLFDEKKPRDVKCLVSVAKLIAGFDVPDVELGVMATPTKSLVKWIQAVGRTRRVAPGKQFGEILDLGQCISNHGFPEDPFNPPEPTEDIALNRERLETEMSKRRLEYLDIVVEDKPTEITREKYEKIIEEIRRDEQRLTNLTVNKLISKLAITDDPVTIIAIAAVLFDKIHCIDTEDEYGKPCRGYISNKQKLVKNFLNPNSISWIAETWVEALEKETPYYRNKYIKALKTRIKNLLQTKGSIYALRFFIDYLLEQDEFEKAGTDIASEESTYEMSTESGTKVSSYQEFTVDPENEEIPF